MRRRARTCLEASRHTGDTSMILRRVALVGAVLLATATAALAQSHQGGYLGRKTGSDVATRSGRAPAAHGAGQGGYLGLDPGAHLSPALPEPTTGPMAWC